MEPVPAVAFISPTAPGLTYSGSTWEGVRELSHDNLSLNLWIRVLVTYE